MPIGSATLDKIIQKVGSWIMVNIGSENINTYGEGSYTYTTFSGEGYVQVTNDLDDFNRTGTMPGGDAIAYFRMNADIPAGSKVFLNHQGLDYEYLGDPVIPHISGNQLLKIISLRRRVP